MKDVLECLFDFQRFAGNAALDEVIADTESRYDYELSDEDLEAVNAAGEPVFPKSLEDKPDE